MAKLEQVSIRTLCRRLAAGFYPADKLGWQRSTGGNGGRRRTVHWSALSSLAQRRLLVEERERLSSQALAPDLRAYQEAPVWAQGKADARKDLLELLERKAAEYRRAEPALTARAALERALRAYNSGGLEPELLGRLGPVALRTAYRWRQKASEGLGALTPRHGGGRRGALTDEMRAEIARMLWERWPRATSHVFTFLGQRFGQLPSYRTIRRFVERYEREHLEELLAEFKPSQWRHNYMLALGDASASATAPNAVWEADTTPADILCKDGKRRKIIALVDVYSRRAFCRLVEKEDAAAVAATLRGAFLAWGLPEVLKMDNGMVYHKSKHVRRICAELGIEAPRLPVRAPERKPHIERFFRTLSEGLFAELTGYTGNCLVTRPEIIVPKLTAEQLQELVTTWIEAVYHENVHSGTGQRPREKAQVLGFQPRRVDERQLDLLLMKRVERVVRQGVICFNNCEYHHAALPNGQRVTLLIDGAEAGRVIVWQEGKHLCEAVDRFAQGLTPEEIAKEGQRQRKAVKQRIAAQKELLKPLPADARMLERLKSRAAAAPIALPQRGQVEDLPGYRETAEKLAAQARPAAPQAAPDPEAEERPDFGSERERYEWLVKRRCLGLSLDQEWDDAGFMARFEEEPLYEKLRTEFARIERKWSRRRANAS